MTAPIRSRYHSAGALLILLFTSICATAQQPLPQTRVPPVTAKVETKTGNISGSVVNESGQPLTNANIWVQPDTPEGLPVTTTTTNREGVFKVSGLEQRSYRVSASMPSYIPKSPQSGPTVNPTSDAVILVLIKGGVISGTVTNSKGDPIVAIGVRVEMVVDESGRRTPAINYESVTDDRGVYRVYG